MYLVRHPATDWTGVRYIGRCDLGWSSLGRRRADELVRGLRRRIDRSGLIVTSPLRRARLLAEQLAAATGSSVEVDERWSEVDVGSAEGGSFADLEAQQPGLARRLASGDLAVDWPSGERFTDFQSRVLAAFDDARRRPERPVVVISHAGPIAIVLDRVSSGGPRRFVGPGDALALDESPEGSWTVRPAAIAAR